MSAKSKVGGYEYKPFFGIGRATWPFEPMSLADEQTFVSDVLNNITAAVEAGELGKDSWPQQLFESDEDIS